MAGETTPLVRRLIAVGLSRETANALVERAQSDAVIHAHLTLAALCELTPAEAIAKALLEESAKCDRLVTALVDAEASRSLVVFLPADGGGDGK